MLGRARRWSAVAGAALLVMAAVPLPAAASPTLVGPAMVLPADAEVTITVVAKNAAFTHDLWLELPERRLLFAAARPGQPPVSLGRQSAGTELVFSLFVRNTGRTFLSTSDFARVRVESPTSWIVGWEDLGDFDYDDLIVRVSWTQSALHRAILYVHGTTGRFNGDLDFPVLLEPLGERYELVRYRYYEDRGRADPASSNFTCLPDGQRALPPFDASVFRAAGLEPDPPEPAPGICDSNDSIELNAVLIAADVAELAKQFDRVTIIANSGGAAMVRAFLAYASVVDPATLAAVDLAVFLEGVQTGSYLAASVAGVQSIERHTVIGGFVRDRALDALKPKIFHDPRRPVFDDVLPLHALQRYVARRDAIPDGPHYLNVAGDLNLTIRRQFLWWEIGRKTYPPGIW